MGFIVSSYWSRLVSDGNGLEVAAVLSLPILTIICAHLAKRLGVFGEVVGSITNPYHCSLLSLAAGVSPLPSPPPADT